MSKFSDEELAYLAKGLLGRLATIDEDGVPHVVPLGWTYNATLETIDIGGRDFAHTRKFRNVRHNPNVALVVGDVLPSWRPRGVLIRGRAEALQETVGAEGKALGPIVRINPTQVISWGMDVEADPPASG